MKKNIEVYSDMQAQMDFQNETDNEIGYMGYAYCGTVFFAEGDYYMVTDKENEPKEDELRKTACLNLRTGELKDFVHGYMIQPLATTLVIMGFAEDSPFDYER